MAINRDKAIKLIKISQVTHGNTQAEEAKRIGMSTGAFNKFLNDAPITHIPDIQTLMKAYNLTFKQIDCKSDKLYKTISDVKELTNG